jgi:hypothetical protein
MKTLCIAMVDNIFDGHNAKRITELRTQVRTLKRIIYGFGCLFVAGVVVSATSLQTVPDVIQAKKFELFFIQMFLG